MLRSPQKLPSNKLVKEFLMGTPAFQAFLKARDEASASQVAVKEFVMENPAFQEFIKDQVCLKTYFWLYFYTSGYSNLISLWAIFIRQDKKKINNDENKFSYCLWGCNDTWKCFANKTPLLKQD